jgi:hypothetical protein
MYHTYIQSKYCFDQCSLGDQAPIANTVAYVIIQAFACPTSVMKKASGDVVSSLVISRMNGRYKKQRCTDCQQRGPACYGGNGTGRRGMYTIFVYCLFHCSTNEFVVTSILKGIYINI